MIHIWKEREAYRWQGGGVGLLLFINVVGDMEARKYIQDMVKRSGVHNDGCPSIIHSFVSHIFRARVLVGVAEREGDVTISAITTVIGP